MYKSNVH